MAKAKTSGKFEKVCFRVEGDSFTELVRSLWADEGTPEKGIRLLKTAVPAFDNATIIQILTGERKMVGNSRDGMDLEKDNTIESPGGNLLSLEDVMGQFRQRERTMIDEMEYFSNRVALVHFDVHKCALIPINRNDEFHQGKVELADIPHRRPTALEAAECWDPEAKTWDTWREGSIMREQRIDPPKKQNTSIIERLSGGDPRMEKAAKVMFDPPTFDVSKYEDTIISRHGWLSPDGKFYACEWFEHITLANQLGRPEGIIEKRWVKISKGEGFPPERGFTQKQIDLVFDMYTKDDRKLPSWWEDEMENVR